MILNAAQGGDQSLVARPKILRAQKDSVSKYQLRAHARSQQSRSATATQEPNLRADDSEWSDFVGRSSLWVAKFHDFGRSSSPEAYVVPQGQVLKLM